MATTVPGRATAAPFFRRTKLRVQLLVLAAGTSVIWSFFNVAALPRAQTYAGDAARAIATLQVNSDAALLNRAARLGMGADDLGQLGPVLGQVSARLASASTPNELAVAMAAAQSLGKGIVSRIDAFQAETVQVSQRAAELGQRGLRPDQLVADGSRALAGGRDAATLSALLTLPGWEGAYRRLEAHGAGLGQRAGDDLVLAVAGIHFYGEQIAGRLNGHMPSKTIVLSIAAQELWAYQDGRVVQDTLVTTGRPELATDIGAMKVIWKDSPWRMHSPWPRSSPHWYPDAAVRRVLWFTITGEGLHDAYWQPPSTYGPGSTLGPSASHGCVHVPIGAENFLFDWAPVGTPVIVYPGDGSPVEAQLKQITVDAHGKPLTGPKGA